MVSVKAQSHGIPKLYGSQVGRTEKLSDMLVVLLHPLASPFEINWHVTFPADGPQMAHAQLMCPGTQGMRLHLPVSLPARRQI